MNYAATIKAANNLISELPFLCSSPSRQDYEDALALAKRFGLPVSAFVGN